MARSAFSLHALSLTACCVFPHLQKAMLLRESGPSGAGDGYRLSKPAAEEDDKLWDFASLSTLKPQLLKGKAAPEPPKDKAVLKPMRPTDDGSWVQPWSVSGSSRASSDQPSQPVPGASSSLDSYPLASLIPWCAKSHLNVRHSPPKLSPGLSTQATLLQQMSMLLTV